MPGFRPVSWECVVPSVAARISPGGLVVDHLSRCYLDYMPLVRGDSRLWPIRWYFVDDGTPTIPFPTTFYASKVWDFYPDLTICELQARGFPIQDGRPHCVHPFSGSAADWLLGVEIDTPLDYPRLVAEEGACGNAVISCGPEEDIWYG